MTAISFTTSAGVPADTTVLAVPVLLGPHPPVGAAAWPSPLRPAHLAGNGFEGRRAEVRSLVAGDGLVVVAIGLGDPADIDADTFRTAGACLVRSAWKVATVATTLLDAVPPHLDRATAAQALAEGAGMGAYRFTSYRREPDVCRIERVTVVDPEGDLLPALDRGARVAEAVRLARDLVNEPPGRLTPTHLAERAVAVAEHEGLSSTVWDEVAIVEERLGGLAGVGRGSHEPARLVELVYEPPGDAKATVALVGKGITFDSGGLSIKTAEGMMNMKTDMSGAAAVLGAMSAVRALGVPVRVVALLPITENMPGGSAIKPGDVLETRNGKTVEVLNTDAEGRLVLADALALAAERAPDAIVDLATLTGAQVVALGRKVSALLANSDDLADQLRAAAEAAGEPLWRLPLPKQYRAHLDSDVADIKNIGKPGEAGTIVAGLFLQEFVGEVAWAHLDIAGPARCDADDGYVTKGGTGVGVRTLLCLLEAFEKPAPPPASRRE